MNALTIGERLKTLRTLHNYEITTVANFLEITSDKVRSLENNKIKLKVSQLELLCDLYNVDEDYILEGKIQDKIKAIVNVSSADINSAYLINRMIRNIEFINSL